MKISEQILMDIEDKEEIEYYKNYLTLCENLLNETEINIIKNKIKQLESI